MDKKELIARISVVQELGLTEKDLGNHENVDSYCEELLDNYVKEQNLKVLAEFDNFKKRTVREKQTMKDGIVFNTVLPFLDILDDMNRFDEELNNSNNKGLIETYGLINKKINTFLKELNIERVATDIKFDEDLHEAISVGDKNEESGTILEVFSNGYSINGKVLRYPKVVVQK